MKVFAGNRIEGGNSQPNTIFTFYHFVLASFMFSQKIGKMFALKLLLKFIAFTGSHVLGLQKKLKTRAEEKKTFQQVFISH